MATRAEIIKVMRAARNAAIGRACRHSSRKWAVYDHGQQESGLYPSGGDGKDWDGALTPWTDAIGRIQPGESMDVACYSRYGRPQECLFELDCNLSMHLSKDGRTVRVEWYNPYANKRASVTVGIPVWDSVPRIG